MKFRQLRNSIELNADENPSIYMVLCMIESMFRDFKDETGNDVYQAPLGDDLFPTKLIWLCRMVNKIYKEHDDEISRNKEKLERMVQDTSDVEGAMEEYTRYADLLSSESDRNEKLQRELETAKESCSRVLLENQKLEKEIRSMEEEKNALINGKVAMEGQQEALKNKLQEYQDQRSLEEDKIQELNRQLEEKKQEKAQLDEEFSQLDRTRDSIVFDISKLLLMMDPVKKDIQKKQEEYDRRSQEMSEAQEKQNEMEQKMRQIIEQLDQYQKDNAEMEGGKLDELDKLLESEAVRNKKLSQKAQELKDQRDELQRNNKELQEQIPLTERSIEEASRTKEELEAQIDTNNSTIKQLKEQIRQIEKDLSEVTGDAASVKIRSLQTKVRNLEQVRSGLWETSERIARITGSSPVNKSSSLSGDIKNRIRNLEECAGDLGNYLRECASSFRLEEQ